MPTRAERLAQAETTSKARIAAEQKRLTSIASAQREESRKARDKRRYALGVLCEQAGLAYCEDALLQDLLPLCRAIAASADPGATLAACQERVRGMPGTSLEGCAQATPGGATSGVTQVEGE